MDSTLFLGLNSAQREAVAHKDGPMLILAGPGSGKTRVVTHRVAYLIEQGVPDWSIAALTFTNKAADEMRERLNVLAPDSRVWIGTFHRFCAWILRQNVERVGLMPNFTIYDTDESKQIVNSLIDKRDIPNGCDAAKILSAISSAKNRLILPEDFLAKEGTLIDRVVESVYPRYQQALKAANAVDFDDLLLYTAYILRHAEDIRSSLDERFRYIMVDEYQDTNLVQYAIARALSLRYPNLAVTGDPDQSIYGWRGANIRNILEFEKDFQNVHVVRLEENYRSTAHILAVASALIKFNKERKEKRLYTQKGEGEKPRLLRCHNHLEEADTIADEIAAEIAAGKRRPGDYAVFFRMNALSRNFERAFRQKGVPFALVRGLEFFNRKEIKDILAYLQLIYNPSDTVAFQRVVNLPVRGIGRVTVNRIADYAQIHHLSLFESAEHIRDIPGISHRTQKAVLAFTALVNKLASVAPDSDMEVLLTLLLDETKYLSGFNSETEEDKQRLANVQELLSEVREFDKLFDEEEAEIANSDIPFLDGSSFSSDRLGRYLEQAALTSDADAYDKSDRVSLMTLHAAKGLEFPVVYIVALEDGILPHERSVDSKKQLEEERRLLFVGITRAQEELRMSRTEYREYRGRYTPVILSRFLFEMPSEHLDVRDVRSLAVTQTKKSEPVQETIMLSDFLNQTDEIDTLQDDSGKTAFQWEDKAEGYPSKPKRRKPTRIIKTTDDGLTFEENEFCESSEENEDLYCFDTDGNLVSASRKTKKEFPQTKSPSLKIGADLENSAHQKKNHWEKCEKIEPQIGMLLRHPDYGVGFVKNIFGPKGDRIVNIEFLSGAGFVDLPFSDPKIRVLSKGKTETFR